jgi:hypothetical protein
MKKGSPSYGQNGQMVKSGLKKLGANFEHFWLVV